VVALQTASALVGFWKATRPQETVQRLEPAFHMQLESAAQLCIEMYADTQDLTHFEPLKLLSPK